MLLLPRKRAWRETACPPSVCRGGQVKRGVGLWVREGVVSVHLVYQAFMMLAQRRGAGWGYNLVREAGPR